MIAEYLIAALLVIGGSFGLIGSFGLLKFDDPMKRLHAPTKASTVGVGTALVASVIWFAAYRQTPTWQELLIVLLLFVTSPITANFLSKVHIHRNLAPKDLPATGTKTAWATFGTEGDGKPR